MTKQTVPDLKELFKQAAEIAKQVPESMQEAAFNRAVDLLTGTTGTDASGAQRSGRKKTPPSKPKQEQSAESVTDIDNLLSAIDSTQHPGIKSASKVLDRSLMVLQIALNEHGVDGLTTSEVSKILTDKFRISTSQNAVNMALSNATELVDRVQKDRGYSYRIMGPGEEYLAHLEESEVASVVRKKKKSRTKKAKQARGKTAKDSVGAENSVQSKKKAKKKAGKKTDKKSSSTSKVGPKAAITSLIDSGYFDIPRSGPEIQAYLKKKRGLTFDTDPLRMTMLRLVREVKLERDENEEGKYEYHTPKP